MTCTGGQCVEESLRLVNGPSQYEGRLEICLGGGWGTVCDNHFNTNDAIVACRQLGILTEGKLFHIEVKYNSCNF